MIMDVACYAAWALVGIGVARYSFRFFEWLNLPLPAWASALIGAALFCAGLACFAYAAVLHSRREP